MNVDTELCAPSPRLERGPAAWMERRRVMWSINAFLFVSLILGGCALVADRPSRGTAIHMTDPDAADRALRNFFQETSTRWQEVQSVWGGAENSPSGPDSNERVRTLLESEYEKFSTDALMLYLRGNWFDDLEHSMESLRVVVLNGESATGCGPGRDILVPELGIFTDGTLMVPFNADRDFLYRAKAWWNEAGTRIHSRRIAEDLPPDDVVSLKDLNHRFILAYNETLKRFLSRPEGGDIMGASFEEMTALKSRAEMILDK